MALKPYNFLAMNSLNKFVSKKSEAMLFQARPRHIQVIREKKIFYALLAYLLFARFEGILVRDKLARPEGTSRWFYQNLRRHVGRLEAGGTPVANASPATRTASNEPAVGAAEDVSYSTFNTRLSATVKIGTARNEVVTQAKLDEFLSDLAPWTAMMMKVELENREMAAEGLKVRDGGDLGN